jgi:ketosteroid isomerase-like protein
MATMKSSDMAALAERLVEAAANGRLDEIRRAYSPDAVIWHNVNGREESLEENMRAFAVLAAKISDLRYTKLRLRPFDGGFLQQHTLVGRVGDKKLTLDACLVFTVRDGKLRRCEEYFDGAQLSRLGISL